MPRGSIDQQKNCFGRARGVRPIGSRNTASPPQTLLPKETDKERFCPIAKSAGYSPHADVAVPLLESTQLEPPCSQVTGPAARTIPTRPTSIQKALSVV